MALTSASPTAPLVDDPVPGGSAGQRTMAVMDSAIEKIKVWFRFVPREG